MAVDICISISGVTTQHMTPALPLGLEPLGLEPLGLSSGPNGASELYMEETHSYLPSCMRQDKQD